MVAYTATQAYPYQVGTDRPCDAPDVWCDFVAKLEADLVGLDNLLGRLSPAVPVARIVRTTPITIVAATDPLTGSDVMRVPFESVDFDTDNMVDLDRTAYLIIGRRFGMYYMTGEATVQGGTSGGHLETFAANFSPSGSGTIGMDQLRIPGAGSNYFVRASGFAFNNPSFGDVGAQLSFSGDATSILVQRASLSLYWISDRFGP